MMGRLEAQENLFYRFRIEDLRLRGLKGANEEFLLAATAQNLKRMAKMVPS